MLPTHRPRPRFAPAPLTLSLACVLASVPGPQAHAQDATDASVATLPSLQVQGKREAPVSLLKGAQSLKDIPQSVTVIDDERMAQQNLRTLDEVLQQAPGITIQPYQQLTTGYYARGFKVDSFQQDGVPILMGNTASPPQDMVMYERVEILRGANGLMQGTGNPSATVNLVPKRAQKEFAAHGTISAARWNRYRAEADVGGPLNANGTLRARLAASHEDRDFFYDVAEQKSTNLYGIAELDVAERTTVLMGLQHQRIRSITNMAGVPFYKDGSDIGLPRSTYLDAAWDRFDWDYTRVFAGVEHRFANGWQAKLNFNHLKGDADMKYAGANGAIDPATATGAKLTGAAYEFENKQNSLDGYLTGPFSLLGRTHEATIGANWQRTSTEQFTANFVPPLNVPVDVWNWDPHSVPEPDTGPFTSRGPTETTQSGLYAVGRFSLADPLTLVLGARLTQWKQHSPTTESRIKNEFTPYGGLLFDITPEWTAYASYAQIFQPQTQRTWEDELIDPIEGTNVEVGVKGALLNGRLNTSLALFDIRQTNRAQQDPAHPCVGTICYYISSGKVRSRGVEAEVNGWITPDLNLALGYTYNTTKYLSDATSEGQPFARFTPKHIVRLWANYTLPWHDRRMDVGLGIQAQSDFSTQSGGVTLSQGGYALVNMRLGYRFNRHLSAALNVNNLFDRRYYQSLSGTSWNNRYGEPRSIALTLRAEY